MESFCESHYLRYGRLGKKIRREAHTRSSSGATPLDYGGCVGREWCAAVQRQLGETLKRQRKKKERKKDLKVGRPYRGRL